MKNTIIILLILFCHTGYAQLYDDFSDGNFSANPVWSGSNSGGDFGIFNNRLRSGSNKASANFYLSTTNSLGINCSWEFWVNLQFSTSGSNYTDVYLVSDKADLQSNQINGYFVRIGNTDDEISLYKRSGAPASSIKIIDGINGSVAAGNNTVRIRVSRDQLGKFTLEREVAGINSSFVSEGTFIDLSHTNTSSFGIYIQQSTSSFFQKHFFDDFRIGTLNTDTIAPMLNLVTVLDSTTLEATFSEAMDSLSIQNKLNFSISNFPGQVVQINTGTDPLKCKIQLSEPLSTGDFLLTVSHVKDRNGNKIRNNNTYSLNYIKPYRVKYRDIIINEVFPDPSPQIDLPSVEYIELMNNTNETIPLHNWRLSDPSSSATLGNINMMPKSFLILCAKSDTAEFRRFGNVHGISPWPSLNNGGDILKLKKSENILIDSLSYSDTWYRVPEKKQGGWSLERIDPTSICEGPFNWKASIDSAGGTPGKQNSVYLPNYDLLALKADSISRKTDSTLNIYFNKPLNSATILKENFTLLPSSGRIKKIGPDTDFKQLEITFSEKFIAGKNYILNLSGFKDCSGNTLLSTASQFSFSLPFPPPPPAEKPDTAKIFITEVFADPSPEVGMPLVEFVEIFNPGTDTVNLEGWSISDLQTKSTIKSSFLAPKQYLILCPAADTSAYKNFGKTIGISPWPSLSNNADQIVLKSFRNRTLDSIAYSNTWYGDAAKMQGGWSLERIDASSKCTGSFNWTASKNSSGGTPGKQNSVHVPNYDLTPFKSDSINRKSDSTLHIYFNKYPDTGSIQDTSFKLSPEAGRIQKISAGANSKELIIKFSEKFKAGNNYKLSISSLKDCSGNILSSSSSKFSFSLAPLPPPPAEKPDTAKIFITEIFADPSPEVGMPLVEFVEIFNPGTDTIDLEGWSISDSQTKSIIKSSFLAPKQYLILCPAADTSAYKNFGKTTGISPWPSLSNNADQIVLKSFRNRTLDSIAYSNTWYGDAAKMQGGWSLERIDPGSICEGLFNWAASEDPAGGTPGKQNSVYISGYDKLPLKADSLSRPDDSTLLVYFNKPLHQATIVKENFSLFPASGQIKINNDPGFRQITLTFSGKFIPGKTYKLSISNVQNCSGNSISSSSAPLSFSISELPPPLPVKIDTARVFITELFADPSPEVGLPLVEFIEIYNPGRDTLDLEGWSISDPQTKSIMKKAILPPQQYLILCPAADTAQYKSFGRTLGISPWPSLSNNADQIVLKSFRNRTLDSIAYSNTWYGDAAKMQGGWSLERIDALSKCIGSFNWTASKNSSGGTPGKQNSVHMPNYDLLPLKADSIRRTSDSTLYIFFNKSIQIKSISPENFSLTPEAGKVKNISEDTKHEELKITFSGKFAAGKTYELSITDIKDCSGNMINSSTGFSFSLAPLPPVPAERPDTARVLITEIFADPSPEVGLPLVEFVEIFNPGKDTIDLEGWSISDSQTKSTLKKILIAPGQYLILCPVADTAQFKSYGKTSGISDWPSLGNNEDRIFLRSFKDRMVDSVSYSDSWYKNPNKKSGGWSLEIMDLSSKTCPGFYNWAASIDPDGGTPGRINSRYFSGYLNEALRIDSANVLSDSTAVLFFNRIPNPGFLKAPYFQITNGVGKAKFLSIRSDYLGITLEFNQKLKEGVKYTLYADSLYSCSGTLSSSSGRQISFSMPFVPEIDYPLIINEIFADPSPVHGLPEAEFVELFNPTQNTVNLKGLNFGDQVSNYSLKNGEIAAGSYLILCSEKDTAIFKPFGKVIGLPVWPDLNNEEDVLLLKNNKGRQLHEVMYHSGWYKDAGKRNGGYSLELIDPMSVCLSFQNWTASRDSSGGTPGRRNSVYQPDYKPEALKLTGVELIDSLSISLTFNRAVDNLKAIISSNYTLNNGAGSPLSSRLADINFDKVILTLNEPLTRGQTYRIRVNNISDCRNTPISTEFSSLEFTLSKKIEKNDILLTEILFNPRPGGADFVEIYNNSSHALDLKDLSIARIIKDSINSIQQLSSRQFLFEPGTYLALTPDPENIKNEYFPKNQASILKIIPFPAFNDDTGIAVLITKEQKIDQLSYTEKMHFPLLKNTEGVSLERSKLKRPLAEPGNLRSATSASGFATPGYQNSQYSEDLRNSDGFSLVSKTFSPDNDGFEDLLEVTYKFSQPGKIANVSIFDDNGILVKKLLKNFSMNTEGTFIWDGFTEQSQQASSGIYLLQAEIFDTDGQIRKFSRPFVLAVKFK